MRLISRALLNSLPRAKPIIPHHRLAPASASARFYASSPFQPSPTPQLPNPLQPDQKPNNGDESSSYSSEHASIKEKMTSRLPAFGSNPAIDALLATTVGIILVFGGGMVYLAWYKWVVVYRMERAFASGYDPALDLGHNSHQRRKNANGETEEGSMHLVREEQKVVDAILRGEESGKYWLLMGSKGTGKGTMILNAMRSVNADGAAFVEAHPDLEVVRLRIGKALNFDYYEDWQGSLFSRADPRDGGPTLDIERALNKLEKVALKYAHKKGRPLCLIFNNIHLFPDTEAGHGLLHQLQQRAEAWGEAGIATFVFSSDDYWPFGVLKKNASRMRILSVYDLSHAKAVSALTSLRSEAHPDLPALRPSVVEEVVKLVGGRTSYLNRVARAVDPLEEAKFMVRNEREWIMSKIGLIDDCDDDVMDEQKWSSCSWLLLRELAKATSIEAPPHSDTLADDPPNLVEKGAPDTSAEPQADGEESMGDGEELGWVTYGRARQLMTRADFLLPLDHLNIVSLDRNFHVRPDSHVTLSAIRSVVSEEGFDDLLASVMDRISAIESLGRTRELFLKQPVKVERLGRKGLRLTGLDPEEEEEKERKEKEKGGGGWRLFG